MKLFKLINYNEVQEDNYIMKYFTDYLKITNIKVEGTKRDFDKKPTKQEIKRVVGTFLNKADKNYENWASKTYKNGTVAYLDFKVEGDDAIYRYSSSIDRVSGRLYLRLVVDNGAELSNQII